VYVSINKQLFKFSKLHRNFFRVLPGEGLNYLLSFETSRQATELLVAGDQRVEWASSRHWFDVFTE